MWELLYEDTFGFGEDRDPLKVECSGDSAGDGLFILWDSVLRESITGTAGKPALGFARFTLVITSPGGAAEYISIDTDKYLNQLYSLKMESNPDKIKDIACRHYKSFLEGAEEQFLSSWFDGKNSLC